MLLMPDSWFCYNCMGWNGCTFFYCFRHMNLH